MVKNTQVAVDIRGLMVSPLRLPLDVKLLQRKAPDPRLRGQPQPRGCTWASYICIYVYMPAPQQHFRSHSPRLASFQQMFRRRHQSSVPTQDPFVA